MSFVEWLKHVPIDLGQGSMAERTQGKIIAQSLVPSGQGRRALDLGARHGVQTRWLATRGYEVVSGDVEPKFPNCRFLDANLPLPFRDGEFDLVWSSEVLEHLIDPGAALRELRRVLAAGGTMVLTTPNSGAWFFRVATLFGLPPKRLQRADHLHFFVEAELRALFPEAELLGYFPYAGPKRTIRRGLGLLTPTFVLHWQKPVAGAR